MKMHSPNTQTLANEFTAQPVVQYTARVTQQSASQLEIELNGLRFPAKRAVSCLAQPIAEDTVLVAETGGQHYVLAILERQDTQEVVLSTPADLLIASKGTVSVVATNDLNLHAQNVVNTSAKVLHTQASEGTLSIKTLTFLGNTVRAEIEKARVFAGTWDGVFDRLSQRCKQAIKLVEGLDMVRSGQSDQQVQGMYRVHAKDTVVTADELVKMDARQIQLG